MAAAAAAAAEAEWAPTPSRSPAQAAPAPAPAAATTLPRSPSSSTALLEHDHPSPPHPHPPSLHWRRLTRRWRRLARFLDEHRRFFMGEPPASPYFGDDGEEEEGAESYDETLEDGEPSALRHGHLSPGRTPGSGRASGVLNRSTTISVDYLKRQDRRPLHLAWTFFLIYVVRWLVSVSVCLCFSLSVCVWGGLRACVASLESWPDP